MKPKEEPENPTKSEEKNTNPPSVVFTAPLQITSNFADNTTEKGGIRLAYDLRHTGRADLIGFGTSGLFISMNDGKGGFGPVTRARGPLLGIANWDNYANQGFLADTTGDGFPDIIGIINDYVLISRNNGDGTFRASTQALLTANSWSSNHCRHIAVDLTGNGVVDILGFGKGGVYASLNNGDGTFQAEKLVLGEFRHRSTTSGWSDGNDPCLLADLTGNGPADIIGFGDYWVNVSLNNGDGTFQPVKRAINAFGYSAGWLVEDHPRFLADLTGNGRADIIGFAGDGVFVAINNGNGMFQPVQKVMDWFGKSNEAGGWQVGKHPRFVVDITGNNCADIVGFYNDGVWVALNNGDGTFQAPQRVVSGFGADKWTSNGPRFLADLTGNGRLDIVGFTGDGVCASFNVGNGLFSDVANVA
jgi:hypothetical protein